MSYSVKKSLLHPYFFWGRSVFISWASWEEVPVKIGARRTAASTVIPWEPEMSPDTAGSLSFGLGERSWHLSWSERPKGNQPLHWDFLHPDHRNVFNIIQEPVRIFFSSKTKVVRIQLKWNLDLIVYISHTCAVFIYGFGISGRKSKWLF